MDMYVKCFPKALNYSKVELWWLQAIQQVPKLDVEQHRGGFELKFSSNGSQDLSDSFWTRETHFKNQPERAG